jgi:hypothetical protein
LIKSIGMYVSLMSGLTMISSVFPVLVKTPTTLIRPSILKILSESLPNPASPWFTQSPVRARLK